MFGDDGRNPLQSRQFGRPQPPLPCNELVFVLFQPPHRNGLQQSVADNTARQALQFLRIKMPPGLKGRGLDGIQFQQHHFRRLFWFFAQHTPFPFLFCRRGAKKQPLRHTASSYHTV